MEKSTELVPSSPNKGTFMSWYNNHYPSDFLRKVVAELIATFLLVFVTCGAAALSESDERHISKLVASLAGGLIVTVMIYTVGHISGAHMNPTVTIAFAAVRHFPWNQSIYASAQVTGAITAGFTLKLLLHPITMLGPTSPSGTNIQSLIMEIIVSFIMMFVTSAVATHTKAIGELAGIAVGSSVCITSILAGPISGGSMNPARTLGPAVASGYYKALWVYFVGPLLGTLLGACSYSFIRFNINNNKKDNLLSTNPSSSSFSIKLRRLRSELSDASSPTHHSSNR